MLLPISVSAGLIQTISDFLNKGSSQVGVSNVANMTLLASIASPSGITEYNDVSIDSGALVAQSGPSGDSSINRPTSDQISIYIVREGDTLSQIANMYNVSVNTIRWNNDLSGSGIRPGQTLVILPITGVRHTVAKGDTVGSIAKKYKADPDEIAGYNGINNKSALAVGSVIIIPDGEITATSDSYISGSSGLKNYQGYYLRPIVGGRKSQGIHGHNAVDLGAPLGTPILASADGTVIISKMGGWNGGYGNYIVLKHANGTQTLYSHNDSNTVSLGETVSQGDVIGYVGRSGKTTGAHVHFEVRGARNPF